MGNLQYNKIEKIDKDQCSPRTTLNTSAVTTTGVVKHFLAHLPLQHACRNVAASCFLISFSRSSFNTPQGNSSVAKSQTLDAGFNNSDNISSSTLGIFSTGVVSSVCSDLSCKK